MENRNAYYKQWREENTVRVKELNKTKLAVHNRRYAEDPVYREHWKKTVSLQRYKMSANKFDELLAAQGGHCALCEMTPERQVHRMHVDHDHACCDSHKTCGQCTRGILCTNCNIRLSHLELILKEADVIPSPGSWTEAAIRYINSFGLTA